MARMTKAEFWNNSIVHDNLSEIYSCMKICHGKDIDGDELLQYAWRYSKVWMSEYRHTMHEIAMFCKELNRNFDIYFKIICR